MRSCISVEDIVVERDEKHACAVEVNAHCDDEISCDPLCSGEKYWGSRDGSAPCPEDDDQSN